MFFKKNENEIEKQGEKIPLLPKNETEDMINVTNYNIAGSYSSENYFVTEKIKPGHVRVYIWKPEEFLSPGHIAVSFNNTDDECRQNYVSFWPKVDEKRKLNMNIPYWADRQWDFDLEEKRLPDYVVELKSLNTEDMLKRYEEIRRIAENWNVFASTPFLKKQKGITFNCVSVALLLLKAGGLEYLAGKEIVKTKLQEGDKGLPYNHNKLDNVAKSFCSCCGGFLKCFTISLFIIATLYSMAFGSIARYQPNSPILDEYDDNPAFKIITLLLCSISALGTLISCFLLCKRRCCSSNQAIDESEYKRLNEVRYQHRAIDLGAFSAAGEAVEKSKNVLEFPYDISRGLIEHTISPNDKRIKDVLELAKRNELKCFKKNKPVSEKHIEIDPLTINTQALSVPPESNIIIDIISNSDGQNLPKAKY